MIGQMSKLPPERFVYELISHFAYDLSLTMNMNGSGDRACIIQIYEFVSQFVVPDVMSGNHARVDFCPVFLRNGRNVGLSDSGGRWIGGFARRISDFRVLAAGQTVSGFGRGVRFGSGISINVLLECKVSRVDDMRTSVHGQGELSNWVLSGCRFVLPLSPAFGHSSIQAAEMGDR
jgi:hypothetical protein